MSEQEMGPEMPKATRLEVNISKDTTDRLQFWIEYDGSSATKVAAAAIGVYSVLRSAQLEGATIIIRRSDGSYEEVRIPPTPSS